jgi:hypothetical protein
MNEANPKVYKAAVWATGGVGKYAIRTITDRPNLELTRVRVRSDEKKGLIGRRYDRALHKYRAGRVGAGRSPVEAVCHRAMKDAGVRCLSKKRSPQSVSGLCDGFSRRCDEAFVVDIRDVEEWVEDFGADRL